MVPRRALRSAPTERAKRVRGFCRRADDQGKLNGELALLQDSQTLSPLGEMYVSDQSPQYASHLDEDAGTRVLPSPLLLLGLLLAALALV